jgi:hypothetical protein
VKRDLLFREYNVGKLRLVLAVALDNVVVIFLELSEVVMNVLQIVHGAADLVLEEYVGRN